MCFHRHQISLAVCGVPKSNQPRETSTSYRRPRGGCWADVGSVAAAVTVAVGGDSDGGGDGSAVDGGRAVVPFSCVQLV